MSHMFTMIFYSFYNLLFLSPCPKHPTCIHYNKSKAQRRTFRINNCQIKIRIYLHQILFCLICRIVCSCNSRRKTNVNQLVSSLCIWLKMLYEHICIDMVSGYRFFSVTQNFINFFCLYGLAVKIITSIYKHRCRNHFYL